MSKLERRLEFTVYSQAEMKRAKSILMDSSSDQIELAWAWMINLKWAASGKAMRETPAFAKIGSNHPSIYSRLVDGVKAYRNRLSRTSIWNEDALDFIARWDSPQTCFYTDPPYPSTDQKGYSHKYDQADFDKLIEKLSDCEGSVVLSCYDNASVPSDWERHEFSAYASSSHNSNRKNSTERIECVFIKSASKAVDSRLIKPMIQHAEHFKQLSFDLLS